MDTKKIIVQIAISSLFLSFSACEFGDNYEGPNANFHGQLINKITGEPFYSEQPNGFQIKFKEISWGPDAQAQTFQGKYDGSFNWDYLFGYTDSKYDGSPFSVATYQVEPFDGAFEVVDPKVKTIEVRPGDRVEVNFEVIPYISLTEEHTLDGSELTVRYTMTRELDNTVRYQNAGIIVSSRTQYLSGSLNAGGYEEKYSAFKSAPQLITYKDGNVIEDKVTLDPGKTYWIRVGARLSGTERWNYTKVTEIRVP